MQNPSINIKFGLFVVLALLTIFFLYIMNKKSITGNVDPDKQIEYQQPNKRPETGELDFKK
jgi:hypothetical protein